MGPVKNWPILFQSNVQFYPRHYFTKTFYTMLFKYTTLFSNVFKYDKYKSLTYIQSKN